MAPLTLDVSPILAVGAAIQQQDGTPAVWLLHIVNRKQDMLVVIDALTGTIVRQEKRAR